MTHAKIELSAHGRGTIELDGVPVQNDIRSFVLTAGVGEFTQLQLFTHQRTTTFDGEVQVEISSALAHILEKAGWTPPPPPEPQI